MSTRLAVLQSTDYEPYANRVRPGSTGRYVALIHLIKGILGTGILAMPEAFKYSGFILGTIGCVVITGLVTYCMHILFNSMYYFCKRDKIPQLTYPDTFKEALKIGPECLRSLSNSAPMMVNSLIILYQVGVMCVYMIFIATNVKQVFDIHTKRSAHVSQEVYMLVILVISLLLCFIKNLKLLAPVSNVGNWVTLAGLCCIYKYIFVDLEPFSSRDLIAPIKYMPLFMGTSMFSVLSIGAILTIELNMKDGSRWIGLFGVLNQGMLFVTILNIITGFFGYWKYGAFTESSITLNIDINDTLAQVIRILFSTAIIFSLPLQAYPITEILWEQYTYKYMSTSKHVLMWDYIVRTILVLLAFLLAIIIPRLGLFISLFGAFCLSILGMIIPSIIDICIRWPNDFGSMNLVLFRDIGLIIFGLFGWAFGSYSAIREIVESFID